MVLPAGSDKEVEATQNHRSGSWGLSGQGRAPGRGAGRDREEAEPKDETVSPHPLLDSLAEGLPPITTPVFHF